MALKLGEAFLLLFVDKKGLATQMKGARASFERGLAGMQAVANRARLALLMGAGGAAVATKIAGGFQQGMARVKALSGATGESFEALRMKALELGRSTQYSARQAADAMSYFALAGFKANTIVSAMGPTLDLAAAGQMDVAHAADIAAKIMAGMGLESSELGHAVDVLAKAFTTANTDLTMLGEAMKYVGPVGRKAGKGLEELTAAIQLMSNAGIQGTLAGTSLRNILSRLSGATKETNDVFRYLGVEMTTVTGKIRPLADVLDDLNAAMAPLGEAEQFALLMRAFGQRAGPAMAAMLSQGGDELRRFEEQLANAGGTAKRIAEIQMDTLFGALTRLKSAAEGLAITIGDKLLPQIRDIVEWVTKYTARAGDASDETVRWWLGMGELAAKLAILAVVLPKVAAAALAIATLSFNPIAIGIGAVAIALTGLGAVFLESRIRGEAFNDTLQRNLTLLTGLETQWSRVNAQMERYNKLRESGEGVRAGEAAEKEAEIELRKKLSPLGQLGAALGITKAPAGATPVLTDITKIWKAAEDQKKLARQAAADLQEIAAGRERGPPAAFTIGGPRHPGPTPPTRQMIPPDVVGAEIWQGVVKKWEQELAFRGGAAGAARAEARAGEEEFRRKAYEKAGAFGVMAGAEALGKLDLPGLAERIPLSRTAALGQLLGPLAKRGLGALGVGAPRGPVDVPMSYLDNVDKVVQQAVGGLLSPISTAMRGVLPRAAEAASARAGRLGERADRLREQAGRGTEFYGLAEYAKAIQGAIKTPAEKKLDRIAKLLDKAVEQRDATKAAIQNINTGFD